MTLSKTTIIEPSTNVIVISEAGKPIFARFGSEQEVLRICGLVRALCASIKYSDGLHDLGEIRSLRSGNKCMVFMTVGSLTLVAFSKVGRDGQTSTEAFLRLQLEYVYGHILLTLTDQIQTMLTRDPSYDVRVILGATEGVLRSVLDESSSDPASFFVGGVASFFPLSPSVREKTSRVLKQAGDKTPNTVFAMIFSNSKLVTIVQPAYLPLKVSDLHLFRQVVSRQQTSELWLPICLPRINSSGFLHCYTNPLNDNTFLALVSQHGTTEQFELFRKAAVEIRSELGMKTSTSVLEILDSSLDSREEGSTDVLWMRRLEEESEDDYVDASGDGDRMIPYVGGGSEVPEESLQIQIDSSSNHVSSLIRDYLEVAGAHHFVFRLDIPIRKSGRQQHNKNDHLVIPQYISSPFQLPFISEESKRDVWNAYQRLNLRLRLGSATVEATMDAFDMISQDCVIGESEGPGIGRFCPAACLFESPPNIQGVTYLVERTLTYLAMNGKDFEMYITLPSTVPVKQAATLGARLARRLIMEQKTLFLSNPLVWKEE